MMNQVILPELGEGIERATIACWHCAEGVLVKKEDDIVELVTDKASFNVAAECEGKITKIFFQEGDEVSIGEVLATIELDSSQDKE